MPRRNSRPRPKRAKLVALSKLTNEDRGKIAKPRQRPEAAR